jgi:hypothetical protein
VSLSWRSRERDTGSEPLSNERLYTEICSDIRATDEISFKLLGLVPIVSGAAFVTLFFREDLAAKPPLLVTLALFAALITLGLFRWELRNIQRCEWLRRRAKALEKGLAVADTDPAQLASQPEPPLGIGKTEAEKWIYSITILAWLSIPPVVLGRYIPDDIPETAYAILAVPIVFLTGLSIFARDEPLKDGLEQTSEREPSSQTH